MLKLRTWRACDGVMLASIMIMLSNMFFFFMFLLSFFTDLCSIYGIKCRVCNIFTYNFGNTFINTFFTRAMSSASTIMELGRCPVLSMDDFVRSANVPFSFVDRFGSFQ